MADIYTRDQLKAWFKTGAKPTQSHFAALIDSLRHMDDTIDATAVAGLEDLLYTITDQEIATNLTAHDTSTSSHNLGTVEEFAAALAVENTTSDEDDGVATASLDDESAAIPDESVTPSAAEIAAEAAKVAAEAAKLTVESSTDGETATTEE